MLSVSDHVIVPLKLWSTASNTAFFEEKFVFYDCGAHQLYVRKARVNPTRYSQIFGRSQNSIRLLI